VIEINAELLLGRKVVDVNGENVGRIEEFVVELADNACLVEAYLVGASALIDRLSAWSLVRPIRKALRGRSVISSYKVPWQELDLSDPEHPRLTVQRSELRHAN
jgi:sporulation protein YlmC with PRC-barrel domain